MLGYVGGAAIAWAARRPLARAYDPVRTRYFAVAALYGGGILAPALLVFYATFPDWTLMYLANPAHLPAALSIPVLLLSAVGAPMVGFLLVHRLLLRARELAARVALALGSIALVAILVLGRSRLTTVAYYDAFHLAGDRIPILESRLVLAAPVASAVAVGLLIAALVAVQRHVHRAEDLPEAPPAPAAR